MPERSLTEPAELASDTSERLLAVVRQHLPSFWRERPLPPDLRLDDSGIGLDSVDLLELLIACEREVGCELPPDLLLDDAMTVGGLIAKLQAHCPAR